MAWKRRSPRGIGALPALALALCLYPAATAIAQDDNLLALARQFADIRDWDNAGCEDTAGRMNKARSEEITKAIGNRGGDPTFLRELEFHMSVFEDEQAPSICKELLKSNPSLFSPMP